MRIIINRVSTDPYFNLASEEYLLENSSGDVFMLWQNGKSVIIGKNQNAWAEVNTDFAESAGIKVVRRLTGGGAVFHDPGNVNFTFITDADDATGIDFARFASPIIRALAKLGVTAALDGRNDIIADGCKISGNAQCVYRRADGTRRLMHHGTLLYDADMSSMAGVLRPHDDKLRSKGIKSVRSRVGNIRAIGSLEQDCSGFVEHLSRFACEEYGANATGFTEAETVGIAQLAREKYSTWEWNFGRSPEYGETKRERFPFGTVEVSYTLRDGRIAECSVKGDFFGTEDVSAVTSELIGVRLERGDVLAALASANVGAAISGAEPDMIASLICGETAKL